MAERIQFKTRRQNPLQLLMPLLQITGFLLASALPSLLASSPVLADDEDPASVSPGAEPAADSVSDQERLDKVREEKRAVAHSTLIFEHWENGLDVKATSLFANSASSFNTPSMILTAQWNYRFHTETLLGVTFSGMPIRHSASYGRDYTTYYGGVNFGQAVFAHNQYRLVLNIAAGGGVLFIRLPQDPTVVGSTVQRPDYTFIEPGGYLTFFSYSGMDIGLTASYRYANLRSQVPPTTRLSQDTNGNNVTTVIPGASNASISSANFGLTFRTMFH